MSIQVWFKITIKGSMPIENVVTELNNLDLKLLPYSVKKLGEKDPYPREITCMSIFPNFDVPTVLQLVAGQMNSLYLINGIDQIKIYHTAYMKETKSTGANEKTNTPTEPSEIIQIIGLLEKQLRKVIRNQPKVEKEVQDGVENLFIGAGFDGLFTRDVEVIPYSSKSYKPDFLFSNIQTVVEIKLCNSIDDEKEIVSEINDDIVAYKTRYSNLIFVVYDLGIIRNQDNFRSSIVANDVVVKVIKH